MNVSDLIAQLHQFPPDALVVLPDETDETLCAPLEEVGFACYTPRTPWRGELDTADASTGLPAVVLWPTE